jgi:CO/xanthine dehydrogenase FAD-binding subunit
MLLPKFEFHEPKSIREACKMLAEFGAKAKVLAGGTDLMVNLKKKIISPDHLVSLGRLEELKQVEISKGKIRIGACVTVAQLAESRPIRESAAALATGAAGLGTPLVRNLATIGGNIGSARPAADLPPSLLAYGATATLANSKGKRQIPLKQVFVGPGLTCIKPDEMLTEISFDIPPAQAGAGYINLGVRKSQDCNIVSVASYIQLNAAGAIEKARIVMGSVGPTHLRSASAEKVLTGEKPGEDLFARAAKAATEDCRPILDFRGSAEYRRDMVGVLANRTLGIAWQQIRERAK